jgi:hypothetical protein
VAPAAREELASAHAEELARAHWVEGRLVFPPGTPLDEEAYVLARGRDFEHGQPSRARVEPDGRFRVAFAQDTRTGWLALEARYLYLEEDLRLKLAELPESVLLEPRLGGRIAGRLRAPEGVDPGTIGGRVELLEIRQLGNSYSSQNSGSIEITPALTFAFDGLSSEWRYRLHYQGDSFVSSAAEVAPEPGQTLQQELVLGPGVTLAGRVLDARGNPLEGAFINTHVEGPGIWSASRARLTRSDAAGAFRIQALAPGKVQVQAQLEGYRTVERSLGLLDGGDQRGDIELVLERGNALAGRVVWPDGSPAEATVAVQSEARAQPLDEPDGQKTADDGAFQVSGLGDGPFRIEALATKTEELLVRSELTGRERKKKKHTTWKAVVEHVPAGTNDLLLTLSPGLALSALVVDDLGAPVTDFQVTATRIELQPGGWRRELDPLQRSFRDTDGSFTLEGFVPGQWQVSLSARGHGPSEPAQVELPGAERLVLVLPREARVRGHVVDASGAVVPGAHVRAEREHGGHMLRFFGAGEGLERSDASGAFELTQLAPGTVRLVAQVEGRAPSQPLPLELAAGETRSEVVLELRLGATILGQVLDAAGRPDARREVSVANWEAHHHSSHETDDDGSFRATGLPPGEFLVWAETEEGFRYQEQVTVAEGETVQVRLRQPDVQPVHLHGHVLAGGEPLAGIRIGATLPGAPDSEGTETDAEGYYELLLPGAGDYRLYLGSELSWSTAVSVPEAESFVFDVAIPLGRISGRVRDESGRPLAGIPVHTQPERHGGGDHGTGRGVTGEDGRFELSVPAGLHTVKAGGNRWGNFPGAESYAEQELTGISVSENGEVRGLELVLGAGGTLAGTVRLADGSPAGRIFLLDLGPEGRGDWLGSADDGRFEIDGLEPGRHQIGVRHSTLTLARPAEVEIEVGEVRTVELVLVPGTSLAVRVVDAQGRPAECGVALTDAEGLRRRIEGNGGRFQSEPLPPGTYTLRAEGNGRSAEREVTLAGGETSPEIELRLE